MMKKLLPLIALTVLFACGGNSNSETEKETSNAKEKSQKTEKTGALSSCDDFLDDYEDWVEEVIEVYKKAKDNPMDLQNTQKLVEVTEKMSQWSEKWTALYDCANNEQYASRMEKLQEKVDKEINQ